jgi:hypothetical protein
MINVLAIATITILGVWSDASGTAFYSGNDLVPMMREAEKAERGDLSANVPLAARFAGYLTGVVDAKGSHDMYSWRCLDPADHQRRNQVFQRPPRSMALVWKRTDRAGSTGNLSVSAISP